MEMHQVRYFLAAAKTLSFTRGADLCHVSQPALTTAIKKLETRLQSALFHREGRHLLLTEFGRQMLPRLEQIVAQAEEAETVAKNFRLLNQVPVRIGVMSTIGPTRLAGLLAAFRQKYPGIDAAVHDGAPEALAAQLDADELDIAVLNPMEGLGESYRTEPLYTERYVVVLPPDHPLSERNAISLRDLDGLPYVDRLSCEMRELVMGMCENMGIKLYAHFRAEREDWVQAMVMAKIGFAFMPEYSVIHPANIHRPLIDPLVERTISMVTVPGRKHSPAVATFVRHIRAHRWNGTRLSGEQERSLITPV
jgi:DNA-binding transcriptional LysR family regulator